MPQRKEALTKAESFPQLLKGERVFRGWSQADVAAKIGSDPKTVGRWERGLTTPSLYMRQRLSELYGKTLPDLGLIEAESEEASLEGKQSTEDIPAEKLDHEQLTASVPATASVHQVSLHREVFRFHSRRKRWTFVFFGLSAIALLLFAIVGWWSRASALDNPYTDKGTLTLNDSLTANSAAGWSLNHNNEGQCFFADGTYRIRGTRNQFMMVCLAAETYFNDFTYEAQMQVVAGDCGGIAFRTTFPQLYYFLLCQDGRYRFVRYDRDNQTNIRIISSGTSVAIHRGLRQANIVAVTAIGDKFSLYINHALIFTGTDGVYLDGQIGLIVHTCSIIYLGPPPDICSAPVEVIFSNAKVWKI